MMNVSSILNLGLLTKQDVMFLMEFDKELKFKTKLFHFQQAALNTNA
jgi:hypothetical protein